MKADEIGDDRVEEMARIAVRKLKDEPHFFQRSDKALYLVFWRGGGSYTREAPPIEPKGADRGNITYKLEVVPGGPGEIYIVSPVGGGGKMGRLTKALTAALNARASRVLPTESTFVEAEPWMYPDTVVVRGMGRKRSGSF